MKAELVNVIRTDTTEGIGTEESPVRTIRRYWTLDGKLISEKVLLQLGDKKLADVLVDAIIKKMSQSVKWKKGAVGA